MNEKIRLEAKVTKIDDDIKKALKKANIKYPHESLGFFKAVYAKVDGKTPNGNNVILAKSVKDDIPYLIGTQMNRDHIREGYIMGSIIDAYVNKNEEIEIVFTFAKNVYPEDYELALDLMKKGKLTVSFELSVNNNDVEVVKGRYRKLKKVAFDGVGLLFDLKPAYANAHVLETAMKIIERTFQENDKQLLYASAKDITKKWVRIGELIEKALQEKSNKGEFKMDKKTNDALFAAQKKLVSEEFGEEAVKDWSDEDFLNQDKIDTLRESLKATEEVKEDEKSETVSEDKASESKKEDSSDDKKEEKADEKVEDKEEEKADEKEEKAEKFVVEEEVKQKQKVTYDDEKNEETIETESERVVKRDGDVKVVEKIKKEVTYTYAQVEEIKAEYEKTIESKVEEIKFLKENAQKVVELRSELGDFAKDLSDEDLFDEDKLEKARLKQRVHELETASQEEKLKEEKVEEKPKVEEKAEEKIEEKPKDEDLQTGHEPKKQIEEESAEDRISDYLKSKYGK